MQGRRSLEDSASPARRPAKTGRWRWPGGRTHQQTSRRYWVTLRTAGEAARGRPITAPVWRDLEDTGLVTDTDTEG